MPAESIINYRKPGFPDESRSKSAYSARIEYIGDYATLRAALPTIGTVWGDYDGFVSDFGIVPTENAEIGDAFVVCSLDIDNEDAGAGELVATTFEIEWVMVERSMYEHPQFAIGQGGDKGIGQGQQDGGVFGSE